ncbi:hypothetical protein [Rhodoplanes roseus]|uniref:Uncharacterized protein n=1 Tax=Rhodoplanes roseus TaxID=29409 RepID=A0A327L613_9BRAD|nr:hypothetical protein [Rhodoplanes roseus]RAI43068.1 hypothetical protein CH341_16205 [Rhodoplanes roseus]
MQHKEVLSGWIYCAGSALADLAAIAADPGTDGVVREKAARALKTNLAQLQELLRAGEIDPAVREFAEHTLQKFKL